MRLPCSRRYRLAYFSEFYYFCTLGNLMFPFDYDSIISL